MNVFPPSRQEVTLPTHSIFAQSVHAGERAPHPDYTLSGLGSYQESAACYRLGAGELAGAMERGREGDLGEVVAGILGGG